MTFVFGDVANPMQCRLHVILVLKMLQIPGSVVYMFFFLFGGDIISTGNCTRNAMADDEFDDLDHSALLDAAMQAESNSACFQVFSHS